MPERPPTPADTDLFRVTSETLERVYARMDLDQPHLIWPGAAISGTAVVSIHSRKLPVHRVLLYGRTGVVYARSEKYCEAVLCVHPQHWEWDTASARVVRPISVQLRDTALHDRLQELGLLARKFQR